MSLIRKPTRYAHQEGHTDVCYYSGEKRGLVTCGCDGDVRSWLNLMDDDPTTSCISEQAITVISKDGKIFVGNDNNTVQILTYPDLEKEGIVTRFSAPVSALATAKNSSLIVSGACDMRIQVTNINTSDSIELEGHEAPILGLSLDPKEEFVASSSADGSIRVWNIKEKRTVHVWNNVVPKCNSFFIAKSYCTPSFKCTDGSCLAYPSNKDVVIVERSSWKELCRLKCSTLKTDLSICKFSECGTRIAASSLYGEMVVWNVETKEMIGYLEHEQDTKITALVKFGSEAILDSEKNEDVMENDIALPDDDDDDENVISLNKIKASINLEDDQKSHSDAGFEKPTFDTKAFVPNMWNDVGMVRCFSSEDGEECSIEVEFHDVTVHRSMHINNYLRHSLAALSTQVLALSCAPSEDGPSKIVVIVLQGWGSGNKEWILDLPEGEESDCLAAGDNFVAVATSRRNLRIFMIGGTQREILALPGPVVAMNGLGNHLVIAYHAGIASDLMWLGLSDARSPTIMDSDDIIRIYDKRSCQWRVLCDTNAQGKGRADHYFIIGVSEHERNMRCILCKGSYYPPTTPRPIITEIDLSAPLCEPESEKTEKERKLWEIGSSPLDETEAMLTLIALACRSNLEYRAVDICEQIASTKVIDLAIRYALRVNKVALANKLETIADAKSNSKDLKEEDVGNHQDDFTTNGNSSINDQEEDDVSLPSIKKPEIEIKPLAMSQTLKRVNPFLKAGSPSLSPKGLVPLDPVQEAMGSMGPWHIVIAVAISLVKFPVAWHQLSIVFLAPPTNFSCIAPLSATNESMTMKCEVDVGNGTIEECTHFRYDKRIFRESIITQWNLVCDREQLANFAQSCTMFGVLVGNLIFSMMADRIGRKKPLMIAIALQSVTGFASAFAPWYELFLVLKFICALSTGGTMLVSFVLLMEIVGVEWRSIMSVLFHVPFLIGHVMNPLISYLTLTWSGFQMAVSIPSIFLLAYYWIIPESPRWLLAMGKSRQAEQILLKAAGRNKIPVENVKLALETYENQSTIRQTKSNEKYNISHLFRTPNLRLKTIYVSVNWFVCGMCFFGLAQYMGHLDGNIFINVAVSASLGLVGMAISFPTVYLYSCEVFPTVVRNVGVGLGSISARIGSIIAPYIATMGYIQPWLPPVIFGLGPIIGAVLCLFLPETMNCELPETIEDAENFGKKKSEEEH
ncbi:WD repeat and HMG-box DNA-binding protein 1 [Temnothorax longispinosus]|uniref:WD repeat and HMG-box DNA-binding protein 1 n=1 Tax=Temnothorax longispinosus TaxID=300112 RepID=A0A4S2KS88_9HYME|nr:WD repeat and HMG-box DNA-binding protein 1 [Temnothorax longispinosus]